MLKPSLKTFDGLDFDGLEFEGEPHEMITDSTSDEMTFFLPQSFNYVGVEVIYHPKPCLHHSGKILQKTNRNSSLNQTANQKNVHTFIELCPYDLHKLKGPISKAQETGFPKLIETRFSLVSQSQLIDSTSREGTNTDFIRPSTITRDRDSQTDACVVSKQNHTLFRNKFI